MLCLILTGCKEKQAADNGELSEEFKPIYNQTQKLFFKDKTDAGIRYLDSGFNTLNNPFLYDRYQFYSYHFIAAKLVKGDNINGLLYADSLIRYAKKLNGTKHYSTIFSEANFSKGDVLFDLKRYSEAYQYYYQGYLAGKNNLNNDALSDFTYRMGMIMYKQGHFSLAVNRFQESLKQSIAGRGGFVSFYRQQELLDNIALSYKKVNNIDSALHYFDKALAYIDKYGPLYEKEKPNFMDMARGVVYGNKADVLAQRKQYYQAATLLKKSISINLRKGNDYRDAQLTEIKLGQLYLEQNQMDSLDNLLKLMRRQFDTIANENAMADWNRLMSKFYLKSNDYKNALEYLQTYNVQKDSIDEKLSSLKESDVAQQVANYDNQLKIDALSTNNKLQRIYLSAAIVCALLLTLIVFLIRRNFKRSKNEFKIVNALNEQINEQNHVLENALDELNISSREKDRILRAVAHDLRNPLGGIASLTTSMIDDEDCSEEQRELINLIKETSYNSLELINEILEATNNGGTKFNKEYVEINSLLSNSVELLRFKAAEKDQKILLELLDQPKELYISREKIWRVISNLISNATKFSPFGATIMVSIAEHGNDEVEISVKDNGIGIPDNLKEEVFNMFTDAKRPGTAGEKSFGLGLSICKQIIEKHNGKIWFESDRDKGTTFYIRLHKESLAA